MATQVLVDRRHDFTGKLRQESVWPMVRKYISWQQAVRLARRAGKDAPEMPEDIGAISINLDLTTACNYRCDHCIDFDMLNSRVKYKHQKLLVSLEVMIGRGLRSVILIGGGEPTLYPGFGQVVTFLKERSVQVAVVSNGSRNEKILEVADKFTEGDWVRLSLDSGTTGTFLRMHKPVKKVTLEEICSFVPLIRERNPKLSLGFSFIVVWEGAMQEVEVGSPFDSGKASGNQLQIIPNIHEMVRATRLARDYAFNYISFKPFLTRHQTGAEVMDPDAMKNLSRTLQRIKESIAEARTLETDHFKVVESTNLRVLMEGSWRDFTKQPKMCHMQALRQVLSPLGLYNCPAHRGVAKARISGPEHFSGEGSLNKPVAEILDHFDASHECKEVTCLYNEVNRWLENAIKGDILAKDLVPVPDGAGYFL